MLIHGTAENVGQAPEWISGDGMKDLPARPARRIRVKRVVAFELSERRPRLHYCEPRSDFRSPRSTRKSYLALVPLHILTFSHFGGKIVFGECKDKPKPRGALGPGGRLE